MSAVVVLGLRILIVIILYAFAGYAFYLLWKTLVKPGVGKQPIDTPTLILVPSDHSGVKSHHFEDGEILVGRGKTCRLCLTDNTVSIRHAKISFHNNQWWVEDLDSTNGTYLNLMPVTTPTVLADGDTLTFGKENLVVGFETKNG